MFLQHDRLALLAERARAWAETLKRSPLRLAAAVGALTVVTVVGWALLFRPEWRYGSVGVYGPRGSTAAAPRAAATGSLADRLPMPGSAPAAAPQSAPAAAASAARAQPQSDGGAPGAPVGEAGAGGAAAPAGLVGSRPNANGGAQASAGAGAGAAAPGAAPAAASRAGAAPASSAASAAAAPNARPGAARGTSSVGRAASRGGPGALRAFGGGRASGRAPSDDGLSQGSQVDEADIEVAGDAGADAQSGGGAHQLGAAATAGARPSASPNSDAGGAGFGSGGGAGSGGSSGGGPYCGDGSAFALNKALSADRASMRADLAGASLSLVARLADRPYFGLVSARGSMTSLASSLRSDSAYFRQHDAGAASELGSMVDSVSGSATSLGGLLSQDSAVRACASRLRSGVVWPSSRPASADCHGRAVRFFGQYESLDAVLGTMQSYHAQRAAAFEAQLRRIIADKRQPPTMRIWAFGGITRLNNERALLAKAHQSVRAPLWALLSAFDRRAAGRQANGDRAVNQRLSQRLNELARTWLQAGDAHRNLTNHLEQAIALSSAALDSWGGLARVDDHGRSRVVGLASDPQVQALWEANQALTALAPSARADADCAAAARSRRPVAVGPVRRPRHGRRPILRPAAPEVVSRPAVRPPAPVVRPAAPAVVYSRPTRSLEPDTEPRRLRPQVKTAPPNRLTVDEKLNGL